VVPEPLVGLDDHVVRPVDVHLDRSQGGGEGECTGSSPWERCQWETGVASGHHIHREEGTWMWSSGPGGRSAIGKYRRGQDAAEAVGEPELRLDDVRLLQLRDAAGPGAVWISVGCHKHSHLAQGLGWEVVIGKSGRNGASRPE